MIGAMIGIALLIVLVSGVACLGGEITNKAIKYFKENF